MAPTVWVIGGVLAIMEVLRFIPVMIENDHSYSMIMDKFISILHSYVVIQVFVEPIVKAIHKWLGMFSKANNIGESEKVTKPDRDS